MIFNYMYKLLLFIMSILIDHTPCGGTTIHITQGWLNINANIMVIIRASDNWCAPQMVG